MPFTERQYYVYIMTNKWNNVLYIGVTNNLERRVYEHKKYVSKGFTSKYHLHKLVYYETYGNIEEAILREKQLKGGSRQKKIDLIQEDNPDFKDLTEGWYE